MSDEQQIAGFPLVGSWQHSGERDGGPAYAAMIETLRGFLDAVAAAKPDAAALASLTETLAASGRALAPFAVGEREQPFAHQYLLPGRGQTMAPALIVEEGDAQSVRGTVTFGRYFLGGNGAVHGGAIPLLFDEVLGRLANAGGRARSRTAYLKVDYRSITPIGRKLDVRGWYVSEEGRKRLLRAELRDGDTLCAEAEGLFVALREGQP